ncbi:MAG TPA: hypothetical protein VGF60_12700 [Xanthobacteraceae bacterium]
MPLRNTGITVTRRLAATCGSSRNSGAVLPPPTIMSNWELGTPSASRSCVRPWPGRLTAPAPHSSRSAASPAELSPEIEKHDAIAFERRGELRQQPTRGPVGSINFASIEQLS